MANEMKKQRVDGKLLNDLEGVTDKVDANKGLQQYFTPPKFADWLASLYLPKLGNHATIGDLTAGSGNLLAAYENKNVLTSVWSPKDEANIQVPRFCLFGVEVDRSNLPKVERTLYKNADLTKLYPYLAAVGFQADLLALNPPFGLKWDVPGITSKNSALATLEIGLKLLSPFGTGYCIMSRSNFDDMVQIEHIARHVYATVHVKGLFLPDTAIDTSVVFFANDCQRFGNEDITLDYQTADESDFELIENKLELRRRYSGAYIQLYGNPEPRTENEEKFNGAFDKMRQDMGARKQSFSVEIKGGKLKCRLTLYEKHMLKKELTGDEFSTFEQMNGVAPSYFGFNTIAKKALFTMIEKGMSIQPEALEAIKNGLTQAEFLNAPNYPLTPPQRLGWLVDLTKIKCLTSGTFGEASFEAGKEYDIFVTTQVKTALYFKKDAKQKEAQYQARRRAMSIRIGNRNSDEGVAFFDEEKESLEFLIQHFEIPNPKDVRELNPAQYDKIRKIIESPLFEKLTLKEFQVEDLTRGCMKESTILSWDQGIGKTRGILVWALVMAILRDKELTQKVIDGEIRLTKHLFTLIDLRILFVIPKNIQLQWFTFLDEMEVPYGQIADVAHAREIATTKPVGIELYVIDYNLLKSSKRFANTQPRELMQVDNEMLNVYAEFEKVNAYSLYRQPKAPKWPTKTCTICGTESESWKKDRRCTSCGYDYTKDVQSRKHKAAYLQHRRVQVAPMLSKTHCPNCKTVAGEGWSGLSCKKCGFTLYGQRFKGMNRILRKTFDIMAIDEAAIIKNSASLAGAAVARMKAGNRLVASGSPIKAYIRDMYSLMHWTLGNANSRFPYDNGHGGMDKFLTDYGVWETRLADRRKGIAAGTPRLIPEISNLALWWKLFYPAAIRRRKEDTGENIVEKMYHEVPVPFSDKQRELYAWWITNFKAWYQKNKNPMDSGGMELIKGLLWKMRFVATVPDASNLWADNGLGSGTNFTPKMLATVNKTVELLKKGRRIVIFSALKENANFLQVLLSEYEVNCEVVNGDISPLKQGERVKAFQEGKLDVLIAGTDAMKFGHNIDQARAAIFTDFVWNASDFRQAVDRIHRLSSQHDIDIYVIYTKSSVDEKLKELVEQKGAMADMAIDGELMHQKSEELDFAKLLKDTIKLFNSDRGAESFPEIEIEEEVRRSLESYREHLRALRMTMRTTVKFSNLAMDFDGII